MHFLMLPAVLAVALAGTGSYAAEPLAAPRGEILLTVSGNVQQTNAPGQALFDREMLEALGLASFTTNSAVADKPQRFEGVPLRAVLERVGGRGRVLTASALNDYEVDIPWEDLRFEPLIAMRVDGELLKLRDKGPLWIVYPRDAHRVLRQPMYDARWVWQFNRLHVEGP